MLEHDTQLALEKFNETHPTFTESQTIPGFYQKVFERFPLTHHENTGFIVVAHLLHTLPYFLHALSKMGRIICLIPKSSFTPLDVSESIRSLYKDIIHSDLDKETLTNAPEILEQYLEKLFNKNPKLKLVIADHGGYFAPCMDVIARFKGGIHAIFEHTANGEAKYKKLLSPEKPLPVTIISFANTELKKAGDAHIGHSIVAALEELLGAEGLNQELHCFKKIAIIGFGNIGQSLIAYLCALRLGGKVCIYDTNKEQREKAKNMPQIGAVANSTSEALENADLVFLAICSGEAIKPEDLPHLSQTSIIVSVTSADDLLKPNTFSGNPDYQKLELLVTKNITAYQHKKTKQTIYLAADGAAVNFERGGSAHPSMHAIFASQCVAIQELISSQPEPTTILPSSNKNDQEIFTILQETYGDSIETHSELRLSTNASIQTEFSGIFPFVTEPVTHETSRYLLSLQEQQGTADQLHENPLTEPEALKIFSAISKCDEARYSQELLNIIRELEGSSLLVNIAAAYIQCKEIKSKALNEYLANLESKKTANKPEDNIHFKVIMLSINQLVKLGGQQLLQFLTVLDPRAIPFNLIEVYFSILYEDGQIPGGHTVDSLIQTSTSLALTQRPRTYNQWASDDDIPYYSIHPQIQEVAKTLEFECVVNEVFLSIIVMTAYKWLQDNLQTITNPQTQEDLLIHIESIIDHVKKHYKATTKNLSLATNLEKLISLLVVKKIELGDKFHFQQDTEKAFNNYDGALRYNPADINIRLKRIDMRTFFQEHTSIALNEIEEIRKNEQYSDTQKIKMYYQEALIWIKTGNRGRARDFLATDLGNEKHCVNSVELLIARITVLHGLTCYDPTIGDTDLTSMYFSSELESDNQISRHIKRALELEPRNTFILNFQGWLLLQNHDYPAAEQCFRTILETCNGIANPHYNLADALLGQDKYREALNHFVRAFELANTEYALFCIFNKLAFISLHSDYLEPVLETLEKLSYCPPLIKNPNKMVLVLSLKANLYWQKNNKEKARQYCKEAHSIKPLHLHHAVRYLAALLEMNEYPQAMSFIKADITTTYDHPTWHFLCGLTFAFNKQDDEACNAFAKLPGDADYLPHHLEICWDTPTAKTQTIQLRENTSELPNRSLRVSTLGLFNNFHNLDSLIFFTENNTIDIEKILKKETKDCCSPRRAGLYGNKQTFFPASPSKRPAKSNKKDGDDQNRKRQRYYSNAST